MLNFYKCSMWMHKEGAFSIIRKCSIHISQVYHCLFISSISLLIAFVHLIYLVLKETNMRIVVYYFFFFLWWVKPSCNYWPNGYVWCCFYFNSYVFFALYWCFFCYLEVSIFVKTDTFLSCLICFITSYLDISYWFSGMASTEVN